ncbi:hypothetical protein [uncultured Sphingomonas sp.]|uniref:hypothetical protein n=1 Tax=uncultured Sphingomonas sp. TaxID=158754 RepID=UPI0035C9A6F0
MTAAYRLKGIGWFAVLVGIVLGFYLMSLRVAAERKKLDDVDTHITVAERDIRALETEFDTRANLAQLEKWNGDTLALAAPTAGQFVRDEGQLAALDPNGGPVTGPEVKTAALVVPSAPAPLPTPDAPAPAPVAAAAAAPARLAMAVALMPAPAPQPRIIAAAVTDAAMPGHGAEAARLRPAVALLDRKLLSDATFGDLLSGARAEARRR